MEQYRIVQGYEGLYEISDKGNVKSLGNDKSRKEKILKPTADNDGYLRVNLYKEGKQKHHKVHRLVASAFIDNTEGLNEVNHIDEDKTNNCVENLEWCTHEYNNNYGSRNQRVSEALSIPVDMLTKEGELIRSFQSSIEAERFLRSNGFPKAANQNINSCCKGKLQSCYGFKWRYTNGN